MENEFDTQVTNEGEEQTTEFQNDSNESGASNHFTDREKQLYARLQREKERTKELEELMGNTVAQQPRQTTMSEERLELIARGYEDEEIDFILKNGGKKSLKDEFVQSALKARKDRLEIEAKAVNNVSSKSGVSRSFTEGQVRSMSAKEYQEKVLRQ